MNKSNNRSTDGFSFKERLFLTVLLAVGAPTMLFVTGALDIYANNVAELEFVLGDFIVWNIIFSICTSAVIVAILLPMKRRLFDYTFAVLFWLSFALFLQGNYLNFSLSSLSSDGTSGITAIQIAVNTVIWLLLGAGIIISVRLFMSYRRGLIKSVATVVLVTIIGLQLVSTASLVLTTDIFLSHSSRVKANDERSCGRTVLSYENLGSVGKSNNIVYFIIDRFDYSFYLEALNTCPEIFEGLDGFTCYEDGLALYPRTYPSIPYLITGVEQDFTVSRKRYFSYAYENSEFLDALYENGYSINIYSDIFYSYETAEDMDFVSNRTAEGSEYKIKDSSGLGMKLALVSMYRYLPYLAKGLITVSTSDFSSHVLYDSQFPRYTTDMKELWQTLNNGEIKFGTSDKSYSFIHFSGTHTPYLYTENFNTALMPVSTLSALKQSFKIIDRYLSEMKRLGVYDNATIVITGDHADIGSDHEPPLNPHTIPIFFKASGDSEGFETSEAQVAQENIIPAVLKSEGIKLSGLPLALGDISEGDEIARRYYFQCRDRRISTRYVQYEYEIIGSARDYKSWVIKKQYPVGNIYN